MKSTKILAAVLALSLLITGCGKPAQSVSGVRVANVGKVDVDAEGRTIEQRNIIDRIKADNDLGAVRHLYVISAYSGQVILYSPVRGKVTSGGKSLTPKLIKGSGTDLPYIEVGGTRYQVDQLPNEDGTYGYGSADSIYWFSPSGRFHQHFLSGGQIVHVSDSPIAVKSVVLTIENSDKK